MKLQDFVSETLIEIVNGVKQAQVAVKGSKAEINPSRPIEGVKERPIEFDVAVTTIEGTETKGGVGIFVGPVGIGTQGRSDSSSSSVSRIKFSVPVKYPYQPN